MLTKISDNDLAAIRVVYPDLPFEYSEFLSRIGFGEVGDIRLYGGPILPSEIYPKPKGDLSHIILFGDDCQGYCFGFDLLRQFSIVEVDPRGNPRKEGEFGFISLIESYLSE